MNESTCAICLGIIDNLTSITLLPCNHLFHRDCLRKWEITQSPYSCPECRKRYRVVTRPKPPILKNDRRCRCIIT